MSHAMRGRPLELAVKRAAVFYRKAGRACLVQQYPRTGTGVDGRVIITGIAPADFIGAIGDAAAAVECKQCERKSFPLANIDADQRAALDAFEEYGFDVRLVIDMVAHNEVYVVPWFAVAAFVAAPWRKSLTLDWLRAFGQLVPVEDVDDRRRVMFLDAHAHPDMNRSMLEVWRQRDNMPVISLDGEEDDEPQDPKPSPYAGLSAEEVRIRLRVAIEEGLHRQAREAAKPKRTWAGTRRRKQS